MNISLLWSIHETVVATIGRVMYLLCAVDGFALLNDHAALLDDRSFALPSTDRATIDR